MSPTGRTPPSASITKWDFFGNFEQAAKKVDSRALASPGEGFNELKTVAPQTAKAASKPVQEENLSALRYAMLTKAVSPVSLIFLTLVYSFFPGGGYGSAFSVLITIQRINQSIKAMMDLVTSLPKSFAQFDAVKAIDTRPFKVLCFVLTVVLIFYLLWNIGTMGLIPMHSADFVSLVPRKRVQEVSVGFIM